MVTEASNREKTPFYTEEERFGLKSSSSFIPATTRVWIGRLSQEGGFYAGGMEVWRSEGNVPKALQGYVTTIIVGHLVTQVMAIHALVRLATGQIKFEVNPGLWEENLLNIWPGTGVRKWPPRLSFDLSRGQTGIKTLVDKWRVGDDIGGLVSGGI